MTSLNLGILLGVLGSISVFWGQIKLLIEKLNEVIFDKIVLPDYNKEKLHSFLSKKYTKSPFYKKNYNSSFKFIKSKNTQIGVFYEIAPDMCVFFRNKLPIIFNISRSDKSNTPPLVELYCIRGTVNLEKLLSEFGEFKGQKGHRYVESSYLSGTKDSEWNIRHLNTAASNIFLDKRIVGFDKEELESEFNSLYIDTKESKVLKDKIVTWFNSRNWFYSNHLPWKMGVLLTGKPGTGKTSFVREIANTVGVNLFQLDLNTFNNASFSGAWEYISNNTPCIVLIEDIDRVFNKDVFLNNSMKEKPLTLDCVLNKISGIENNNGILTIITANNNKRIDSSICQVDSKGNLSRPGRIDYCIEFKELDKESKFKIMKKVVGKIDNKFINSSDGMTVAQFSQKCIDYKLKEFLVKS